MELGKLTQGQKVSGAAGLILLISLWLSWYGADVGGGVAESILDNAGVDTSVNAWQSFDILDLLLFITALAAIAFAVMAASGKRVDLPVSPAQIVAGLGALSALAILYRIINQPGPNDVIDLKYGVFIGLLAALGVAYGGWRAMQEGPSPARAGQGSSTRDTAPAARADTPPAATPTAPAEAPPAAAPPPATPPAPAPPTAAPPADPPTTAAPAPPAGGAPPEPPSTPTTPPRSDPPGGGQGT